MLLVTERESQSQPPRRRACSLRVRATMSCRSPISSHHSTTPSSPSPTTKVQHHHHHHHHRLQRYNTTNTITITDYKGTTPPSPSPTTKVQHHHHHHHHHRLKRYIVISFSHANRVCGSVALWLCGSVARLRNCQN